VDRLSRFQQRDAIAYLSEKTGAKGRTLTVPFKFAKGRTKGLTAQRRRIIAPLARALTGRFSPSRAPPEGSNIFP